MKRLQVSLHEMYCCLNFHRHFFLIPSFQASSVTDSLGPWGLKWTQLHGQSPPF